MKATTKQETIQYLTATMAAIQAAYFKGRMQGHPLWVHERSDDSTAISIDLYNFEGDGKPVCDGLNPCTITFDDGTNETGWLFCMAYEPDDVTPLSFVFEPQSDMPCIDIEPESVPEEALQNIVAWLEKLLTPNPSLLTQPKNDVTSFFYYMWNRWSEQECRIAFKDGDYRHFWNKWCQAYDCMGGPRGAAEVFYMELSDTNRNKLVARALECYDGMSEKQ